MEATIENNKLIAEFMGYRLHHVDDEKTKPYLVHNDKYIKTGGTILLYRGQELEFHTSWDWLMPVVEKITLIPMLDDVNTFNYIYFGYDKESKEHYVNLYISEDRSFNDYSKESKIEATYKAVIEFIKWYNENKK